MLRKGVSNEEVEKRLQKANMTFPDALVQNYEPLIGHLDLPDPGDCHVPPTTVTCFRMATARAAAIAWVWNANTCPRCRPAPTACR